MTLLCPHRVSHLWYMAMIDDSDPVFVLVRQPSPLCFPVRAGGASFKLRRKKGKMSGLTDTRNRENVYKTCIENDGAGDDESSFRSKTVACGLMSSFLGIC